ncbi:Os03g0597050 [Oryza sativa Japonica Group]|uniref:Os03g0597050 protein n=1 Tax=Oryza sativa subsp. japonica TaxID=39947 RepID=A0A0P0W0T0_ORYSJ|nr:Os03g0597050 [Oryza sativa Japonica Group]
MEVVDGRAGVDQPPAPVVTMAIVGIELGSGELPHRRIGAERTLGRGEVVVMVMGRATHPPPPPSAAAPPPLPPFPSLPLLP